jgi:hypothetical protein
MSAHRKTSDVSTRPFEVRIGGIRQGRFETLKDATASAHIAQIARPESLVTISDVTSGQQIIVMAPHSKQCGVFMHGIAESIAVIDVDPR